VLDSLKVNAQTNDLSRISAPMIHDLCLHLEDWASAKFSELAIVANVV